MIPDMSIWQHYSEKTRTERQPLSRGHSELQCRADDASRNDALEGNAAEMQGGICYVGGKKCRYV